MKPKEIKWLKECQEWYFMDAVKYINGQPAPASLPFKQPPIETFNDGLHWYRKAKKWHDKLAAEATSEELKATIPPPPPPPPNQPPG